MTTFLILGASGALGRALYAALKSDTPEAHVMGIGRSGKAVGCDTACTVDVLDHDAVLAALRDIRPDAVFLTAWETRHGYYWTAPENERWADATIAVLAHCAEQGIPAVFAGTCAEYAWGPRRLNEDMTTEPSTLYGQQKRRVSDWIAQANTPGIASARLFFPFGAAENPNRITTLVARAALRGADFHLKAGDVWYDIYPTLTAAQAMVAMMKSNVHGVFNLTSGQPEHLGHFLDRLAGHAGTGARVTWDPYNPDEHGPAYLAGDNGRIAPFWPKDQDIDHHMQTFLAGLGDGS